MECDSWGSQQTGAVSLIVVQEVIGMMQGARREIVVVAAIVMQMVVLIGTVDSCSLSSFASQIPLRRPTGILLDLCMIIERAMYTDDQSGNNNPNVFGSWPPHSTLFYESGHITYLAEVANRAGL